MAYTMVGLLVEWRVAELVALKACLKVAYLVE